MQPVSAAQKAQEELGTRVSMLVQAMEQMKQYHEAQMARMKQGFETISRMKQDQEDRMARMKEQMEDHEAQISTVMFKLNRHDELLGLTSDTAAAFGRTRKPCHANHRGQS
eukprot:TRINITY_DN4641_c0_g1_i4.p1 TRINITY_DN4641_c0_g1~~TRINITY_DN4641_c0_g1_i4.p1  ORF type:complete len:111 (+),score=18.54 TRINITY_DN4641_c0_g1_i4:41-373(+)